MMAKKKMFVKWQDGTTDAKADNYRTLTSNRTYEDFMQTSGDGEEILEDVRANPDQLTELEMPWRKHDYSEVEMQLQMLEKAVASLTDQQRQAWELVHERGLTEKAASVKMGVSQPAVHKLATKALASVRKSMGVTKP